MLVIAPARGTIWILARVGLLGCFGEEAALFAASDAAMRPQSFEDHFGGGGNLRVLFLVFDAETLDVIEQVLDVGELAVAFGGGSQLCEFQFAAQFEPLHHGLKIYVGESFGKDAADGRSNQFAGYGVRTFEFALVFKLELSGDRRQSGRSEEHTS